MQSFERFVSSAGRLSALRRELTVCSYLLQLSEQSLTTETVSYELMVGVRPWPTNKRLTTKTTSHASRVRW
jgi:hypothetical protein